MAEVSGRVVDANDDFSCGSAGALVEHLNGVRLTKFDGSAIFIPIKADFTAALADWFEKW